MKTTPIIAMLLLAAAGCLGQETPARQDAIPAMDVDFVLKNAKPVLHEPLWADLSVANNGTSDVTIDFGANYIDDIHGSITTPAGTKVEIRSPYQGGFAAIGKAKIAARQSWARTYLLNDWYDFSTPGRYEIALHVDALPDPKPLVIEIGPRDETKLKTVYAELLASASSRNAQVRLDSARALSLANDPAAVPSLVKLLASSDGSAFARAAEGLARIADKASIEALLAAATDKDPFRRQTAAYHLQQARPRIDDRALLKRVDAAIGTSVSPH